MLAHVLHHQWNLVSHTFLSFFSASLCLCSLLWGSFYHLKFLLTPGFCAFMILTYMNCLCLLTVFLFYCCIALLPKSQWLKIAFIDHLMISMGQVQACLLLQRLTNLQSWCWPWPWSPLRFERGGVSFQTCMLIGRIQFLADDGTENLSFFLAVGCKLPSASCQVDLSKGLRASSKPEVKPPPKMGRKIYM